MEIAEGIHRVEAPLGERYIAMYVLFGQSRTLVVDVGVELSVVDVLAPFLRSHAVDENSAPWFLYTHCDFDHAGGSAAARAHFPRSTHLAHRGDAALVESIELLIAQRYGEFIAPDGYDDVDADSKEQIRSTAAAGPVDVSVVGGELIRLSDDWSVEILHTPGHSFGSISIFDPRSGAVIIGDAVLDRGLLTADGRPAFPPTYRSVESYRSTIQRLLSLSPSQVATSHFPMHGGEDGIDFLRRSLAFADQVEQTLKQSLVSLAGESIATLDLIKRIRTQLGPWSPAISQALIYPVVGHLELLEAQGFVESIESSGSRRSWRISA